MTAIYNPCLARFEFSSLMIELPNELAQDILQWGKSEITDDMLYTDPKEVIRGRQSNMHVTLFSGLYSNSFDSVRNLFPKVQPFECTLQEIGIFHNEKFDVLMIQVSSEDLLKINQKLCRTVDFEDLYCGYVPHVTIAYVKRGKAKNFNGMDRFRGRKFTVKNILFSSKTQRKFNIELDNI